MAGSRGRVAPPRWGGTAGDGGVGVRPALVVVLDVNGRGRRLAIGLRMLEAGKWIPQSHGGRRMVSCQLIKYSRTASAKLLRIDCHVEVSRKVLNFTSTRDARRVWMQTDGHVRDSRHVYHQNRIS
jgi:hypothetical protein